METLRAIGAWLAAHPWDDLLITYAAINVVVAVTPKRYQTTKWFGGLLVLASRITVLVHADAMGTLQLPFLLRAIIFGGTPATLVPAPSTAPPVPPPGA